MRNKQIDGALFVIGTCCLVGGAEIKFGVAAGFIMLGALLLFIVIRANK